MKKLIIVILACLCFCGCSGKKEEETIKETPLTDAYVEAMEDYEIMEVALLGCSDGSRTVGDVLNRAKEKQGLELIEEIGEDHIIYGKNFSRGDYV